MSNKFKIIIAFVIGLLLSAGITIAFASDIFASSIKYKDGTVESALDDLYTKSLTYKI